MKLHFHTRSLFSFGSMLIVFVMLQGCKTEPFPAGEVCYDTEIAPIIIANCAYTGCHDAATKEEGVDLSSFSSIIKTGGIKSGNAKKSEFYQVLNESGDEQMPPDQKLSEADIGLIYNWIEQGAENVECATFTCDTSTFSFSENVKTTTDLYCKSCHSGSNPDGGVLLTNYDQISASAANGSLAGVLRGSGNFPIMPPGNALEECEIRTIEKWVENGSAMD